MALLDETRPDGDLDNVSSLDTYMVENRVAINLNTTHRSSDGSDHSFINQSVVSGGAPTFVGTNFTAIPDAGLSSGATVESAGAGDSGKLVKLNASGKVAASAISASIETTALGVVGLTVSEILRVNAGGTAIESAGLVVPASAIVGLTDTQNLTNKTLTTPMIDDGDADVQLTSADQTHATPVVTIPDIVDAADVFCMVDTAQTLTNKTLTTPTLSIPVIGDFTSAPHDHSDAAGGATVLATDLDVSDLTLLEVLRVDAAGTSIESASVTLPTGNIVGLSDTQNLTNKTLTTPMIDDGDADVQLTSADQTHATPVVTIPDIVDAADTFVMVDTVATLTNKTLTAPVIGGVTQVGVVAAPGSTPADTFSMWAADASGAGTCAPFFLTEDGVTLTLMQTAHADQADQGAMTTIGANTGTAGAALSLIGDTSTIDQAATLMNDLAALMEDIQALDVVVSAIRTALINTGILKGSA